MRLTEGQRVIAVVPLRIIRVNGKDFLLAELSRTEREVPGRVTRASAGGYWIDLLNEDDTLIAKVAFPPSATTDGRLRLRPDLQVCAQCTNERPGKFRKVDDDRKVFICDPCEGDHPRSGRYAFAEGPARSSGKRNPRGIG